MHYKDALTMLSGEDQKNKPAPTNHRDPKDSSKSLEEYERLLRQLERKNGQSPDQTEKKR